MEQLRMQQIVEYRAALYCRLSKDDEKNGDSNNQHADSVSIQTQKLLLEKYCLDHGFSVYDIYADDGYSGLNYERPGFNRMMTDIESGKVNLVITKDLSRLGRDYIQTYYIDVYFKRKRVRYIAVNDGIDTNKDENDIAPFKSKRNL